MIEIHYTAPWCQDADIYLLACQRAIDESAWELPPLVGMSGFLKPAFGALAPFVADPGEIVAGMPITTPAGRKIVGLACLFDAYEQRTLADGWAVRIAGDLATLLASRVLAPRRRVELALPCRRTLEQAYAALVQVNLDCAHAGLVFLTAPDH